MVLMFAAITSCSSVQPFAATSNAVGSKVGESTMRMSSLGIWLGDAGIATAAKNGGISKISTVDVRLDYGLFGTTWTTVVTGE